MTWWWRARYVGWDVPSGWPTPVPVHLLVVVALLSVPATAVYQYRDVWTPLQRRYLPAYVRSGVALTSRGPYDLLQLLDTKGSRLALDHDVVLVAIGTADPVFALTREAEQTGATHLTWEGGTYPHGAIHALLGRAIYHDHTLIDLASPALWGALALFIGGVIGAIAQDIILVRASRTWRRAYPVGGGMPPAGTVVTVEPERHAVTGDALATPPRTRLPARAPRPDAGPGPASDATILPASPSPGPPAARYHRFFT